MTTAEVVASVKPQTRVLYVDVTGETHNAIATDVPHLGYTTRILLRLRCIQRGMTLHGTAPATKKN